MKWRFIHSDIRRSPFAKIILACIASCLTVYYCAELHLGALELLRFMAGALALWIPLGGWLYVLLRNEVPDRIIRIAFSAGSSYALTTLSTLARPRFIAVGFSISRRSPQWQA